jgi:hypothetical protein
VRLAADAYALLQGRARYLASRYPYCWLTIRHEEVSIHFGDNPGCAFLKGYAEGFHVVFEGLCSSAAAPIPDLGIFILDAGFISLDYRMGRSRINWQYLDCLN